MLRALRTRFARIDERPVELIDKEIDDEFAAHLAQLEQDLIDSGTPAAKARDLALSRFGNPHTHKRRCLDVALKERRVKTYLQMTMTFACALLLAVTAATAWYNHRQTTHALDQMATRMDELRLSLNTQAPVAQPASSTPNYNNVYISGTPVQRPGQYAMPMDGLTLRRLMAASGVNTRFVKEIAVRHSPKYSDGTTERISAAALVDLTGPDIDLRNEDLITVVEALR